ncbi:hypothetical protein AB1Y20_009383 [Prymnesium parvum]|uniref:NAD-dependent epimerase/dehydratase domain-containing protein n=1 Tax=Prymnesium parvum TaxID=97485 RepID=A0AB34K4B8_PRYPA
MAATVSFNMHGGRSSVSGIKATVFGCTGFLGSYVVTRLGKIGSTVVLPYRGDEIYTRKLKPMGDLGQMNTFRMSIRKPEDIERAVAGSNVVINLLGHHLETSRWKFDDVHVHFPAALAEICKAQGVDRFIHMSALGSSENSPSKWLASKAKGEVVVRESFPGATIIRPSTMFGDEDRFLNRMAKLSQTLPFVPLVNADTTRYQPVYVDDVAAAIMGVLADPSFKGQTIDLAGPKVYTFEQLVDFVLKTIDEPPNAFNVPLPVGMLLARVMEVLPDAWITRDLLLRQSQDIVRLEGTGFEPFEIFPTPIEEIAARYLLRFRKTPMLVDDGKVIKAPTV